MRLSSRLSLTLTAFLLCVVLPTVSLAQSDFIKCGTDRAFSKFAKTPLEIPNVLRDSVLSPSGRFVIHYDATASNPDSVTTLEYAEQAARLADSAYDFEVGVLGYAVPPFSSDSHYDILLVPKPYGAYGATVPTFDGDLGDSPSGLPLSKCYVVVDNRFTDPIYATKGYDALRITIFHEFFHVIQFGSYGHSSQNSYFQEMSSVWMEMLSSPGIPDWLVPGPLGVGEYLHTLSLSFDHSTTGGYGQGIFLQYLDTLYTPVVVREIWSNLSTTNANPLLAINAVLESHGSNFCTAYRSFGVQAFQSGRRMTPGNVLQRAAELSVDSIVYTVLDSSIASFQSLPTSLQFFARGFGTDTCVTVISRNTDRTIATGDVRMPVEGQAIVNVDDPSSICDTTFCLAPPAFIATVSPNPVTPEKPGPLYFVVSRGAARPVSVLLDVYTLTAIPLRHDEPRAEPYGAVYRVSWNTDDDSGRQLPSGEYLYALTVDGQRSIGKLVIVR